MYGLKVVLKEVVFSFVFYFLYFYNMIFFSLNTAVSNQYEIGCFNKLQKKNHHAKKFKSFKSLWSGPKSENILVGPGPGRNFAFC